MNKIVLENTRDVPLTTDLLAFMQASYAMLEKFTALGGDNYILSGCEVSGSSATPGYVIIKGKLMPFQGGTIQTDVRVIETISNYPVGSGTETEITYHAEFGTSTTPADNVAWSTLNGNRIVNLLSLYQNKVDKVLGSRLITEEEALKLSGIAQNANKYVHPSNPSHEISEISGLTNQLDKKLEVLAKGSKNIGDISGDGRTTISLGITLPDNNYLVVGSIIWNEDTVHNSGGISWSIVEKSTTSFVVHIREATSSVQNISFEYALIKM